MISDDTIVSEKNVAHVASKFFGKDTYIKLEYIESTGTQFINTGFKNTQQNYNKLVIKMKNLYTQDGGAVWHVNGISKGSESILYLGRTNAGNLAFGSGTDNTTSDSIATNTVYEWEYNTSEGYLKLNGEIKRSSINFTKPTAEYNFILFGYTRFDALQDLHSERIYSFSIDENGTAILNLIPVKRKTDGVIGMLDLVSSRFFTNSGTGFFLAGPEISEISEFDDFPANLATVSRLFEFEKRDLYLDRPMSIGRLKYFYDKNLVNRNPYADYKQLEYIEADGNQWINTEFIPNQDTRIVLHYEMYSSSNSVVPLFGSRTSMDGSQAFVVWAYNDYYRFDYCSQKSNCSGVTPIGRRFILADGYSGRFVSDQKQWSVGNYTFSVPNPIYIFGMMENGGVDDRHPSGKIYLCNIFSGSGTAYMERRFIPAKRNSDGVSGLLDILNCTFYESLGEPWIAGPEVGPMPNFALDGYDYIEYAKSSTETYVDTEFTPNQDSRVVMEMQKVANSTSIAQYIFCSRYSSMPEYGILKPANDSRWRDGYAQERIFLGNGETGASLTQRMIIDKNKNVTYIGHGTVNHTYTTFTMPNTMALYGCFENGDGTRDYDIDMNLYWCRIYDNGTLVRNYYPMKRQSDNVVGLYDFVNDEFVTPIQGTLTAGSVIPINIS